MTQIILAALAPSSDGKLVEFIPGGSDDVGGGEGLLLLEGEESGFMFLFCA